MCIIVVGAIFYAFYKIVVQCDISSTICGRLGLGYVLNPLLALMKEEGSVLMLGVAGLLSFSNRYNFPLFLFS